MSGILCQLLIAKGKDNNATDQANNINKPPLEQDKTTKGTAPNAGKSAVLELTRLWHHTNHVVVGDSAFASVNTCVQLHKKTRFYRLR